jgi:hypothetical protein
MESGFLLTAVLLKGSMSMTSVDIRMVPENLEATTQKVSLCLSAQEMKLVNETLIDREAVRDKVSRPKGQADFD